MANSIYDKIIIIWGKGKLEASLSETLIKIQNPQKIIKGGPL